MKKMTVVLFALVLIGLLLMAAACGGDASGAGTTTTAAGPSGGLATTSSDAGATASSDTTASTEATASTEQAPSSDTTASEGAGGGVFAPHDLLSAEEATALVGVPVTLAADSLSKDAELGNISERYAYDLGDSSVFALLDLYEDSFRTGDISVKDQYTSTKNVTTDDQVDVPSLGDASFGLRYGQVHVLYKGYYFVAAFNADDLDDAKDLVLNIEIAKKVLANLKAKIG